MRWRTIGWLAGASVATQVALMGVAWVADDRTRRFLVDVLGPVYLPSYAVALRLSKNVHDPSRVVYFVAATIETFVLLCAIAWLVRLALKLGGRRRRVST